MLISPFGTVETQSQHTGLTDMPKITNFRFDAAWGMLGLVQRMGAIVRFYQGDLYTNLVRVHHLMQKEVKEIDGRQIEIKQLPTPERILACFPGIGRKRAKLLIETFGSAAYAIWYLSTPLEEWDKDVPGIGQKTREKCLEALGGFSLMPFIETKGEPHESDNPPETN